MKRTSKGLRSITAALAIVVVSGCASISDAGYYWGNYAQTSYAYQQDPSEESLAQHKQELERLIQYAQDNQLKAPPGIQAELGYIEQRQGNDTAAQNYYQSEINTFPESRLFLERLTAGIDEPEATSDGGQ